MSGNNFAISVNKDGYCFDPLVCSTDSGHLVAWVFAYPKYYSLYVRSYQETEQESTNLGTISKKDQPLFLKRFSHEKYLLAIETETGEIRLLFLNPQGKLVEEKTVKINGGLLHCYHNENRNDLVLFIYNYKSETFEIHIGEDWNTTAITHTQENVFSIPIVIPLAKDNYIIAWVTKDDELSVTVDNTHNPFITTKTIVIKNFNVDYLLGSRIDDNVAVFGGSDSGTVKFYYFSITPHLTSICNRFWKSEDYKNMAFTLAGLDRGFFLFAEDKAKNAKVHMQRFTHLGTFLYPLIKVDSCDECTEIPSLAQGNPSTLLVYLKYYKAHSQVWGKWLNVRRISEIEQLKIDDVEL